MRKLIYAAYQEQFPQNCLRCRGVFFANFFDKRLDSLVQRISNDVIKKFDISNILKIQIIGKIK